jgi:small subunit ribosomal protein S20
VASGDNDQAQESVLKAISALDRAAEKGIIHRNNAARRKSRLMKLLAASK